MLPISFCQPSRGFERPRPPRLIGRVIRIRARPPPLGDRGSLLTGPISSGSPPSSRWLQGLGGALNFWGPLRQGRHVRQQPPSASIPHAGEYVEVERPPEHLRLVHSRRPLLHRLLAGRCFKRHARLLRTCLGERTALGAVSMARSPSGAPPGAPRGGAQCQKNFLESRESEFTLGVDCAGPESIRIPTAPGAPGPQNRRRECRREPAGCSWCSLVWE